MIVPNRQKKAGIYGANLIPACPNRNALQRTSGTTIFSATRGGPPLFHDGEFAHGRKLLRSDLVRIDSSRTI
jgi:hypothetical protein